MKCRRGQRRLSVGFITTEFLLATALLLTPVAAIGASIPRWSEYRNFAITAARETARDAATRGDADHVLPVFAEIADNYGIPGGNIVSVKVDPAGGPVPRNGTVTVEIKVRAPYIIVPGLSSLFGGFVITERHSEPVDPYRSFEP